MNLFNVSVSTKYVLLIIFPISTIQEENNRKLYQEKMAVIEKKLCYKLFDKISWKEFFSDPNMIICIGFLVIFLWFIFNVK